MAEWNMVVNWKALVHYGRLDRLTAFLNIVTGLLIAAVFVLASATLTVYLTPENREMLIETVQAHLSSREF